MMEAEDRLYERLLVLRCQTGDQHALEELIARYSDRLRYYLKKMLQNTADPDDVLQDIWLDAFRAIPRLTDAGAFRGWLYRIARDRAARQFRGRRRPHAPLDGVDIADHRTDEPEFSAADVDRIHTALDTLSAEHREALVLRFLEDMSYEDIAAITGEPLGTVRSRIHYAKRALRRAIERMNDDE